MPFKSKKQMRYLFAKEPEVAEEFASKTSKKSIAELPESAKKNSHLKKLSKQYKRKPAMEVKYDAKASKKGT